MSGRAGSATQASLAHFHIFLLSSLWHGFLNVSVDSIRGEFSSKAGDGARPVYENENDHDKWSQLESEESQKLLTSIINNLKDGDEDKQLAKDLLTKYKNNTVTINDKAHIPRLRDKVEIEAAKQLFRRMPHKIRNLLFLHTEFVVTAMTDLDKLFHRIINHIQREEGLTQTPNLLQWMKNRVIEEAEGDDSAHVASLRKTLDDDTKIFEAILAAEMQAEDQVKFKAAKELWDRRILPYLSLMEEDSGQPQEQKDPRNELRSIFSKDDPEALTEEQRKWFDEAEFSALKEVWDLRIMPYLQDFQPELDQLREIFRGSPTKLTQEQRDLIDEREAMEARDLLSTTLKGIEGANELKDDIKFKFKLAAEDEESLEKMEVEAALEKFLHVDTKKSQGKKDMTQELTQAYIKAATEYLTSVDQIILRDEIQSKMEWTDKQVRGLAKVIRQLRADAANARTALHSLTADIVGAEALGNEIQNVDHLSNAQRHRLAEVFKVEVASAKGFLRSNLMYDNRAQELLKEIQDSDELNMEQRSRLEAIMKKVEIMKSRIVEKQKKREQANKKLQNERDQGEVNDAVEWLVHMLQKAPGAKGLLNEIKDANELRDDQKQRLQAMKFQLQSSANRMHAMALLLIALLWLSVP